MRRAFGYARVSLDKQVEGHSLEAQKRIIEAICVAEGFALAQIFIEIGVSGSVPISQRLQGKALLEAVRAGDVIVSLKLDRCFRDVADASATLADLQQRNVGLYLKDLGGDVTASSVSNLVFNLLASVAAFERQRIGERTSEAMKVSCAQRRADGRAMGGKRAPFGYRKVLRDDAWYLEPIPAILAEAHRLRAAGVSLRAAAEHFVAQGHQVSHVGVQSLFASL